MKRASIFSILAALVLSAAGTAIASPITWQASKAAAVAQAKAENKLILLLAGSTYDTKTVKMKGTICESDSPFPILSKITGSYVPWFSDLEGGMGFPEHFQYMFGMSGIKFPFIAIIHPNTPDSFVDRTWDEWPAENFYSWLSKYDFNSSPAQLTTPPPSIPVVTPILSWVTSKAEAVSRAQSEGKMILMIAGRDACSRTQGMKRTTCESTSPDIRTTIQNRYIPLYVNIDINDEWRVYSSGLGTFDLPLICVINPNNPDAFVDRTTAPQDSQIFFNRLRQY